MRLKNLSKKVEDLLNQLKNDLPPSERLIIINELKNIFNEILGVDS